MARWAVFLLVVVAALLLRASGQNWAVTIGLLAIVTALAVLVVIVLGVLA